MDEDHQFAPDDFVPALVVGYFKDDKNPIGGKIAATPLKSEIEINPLTVAAMMLSVYECCEDIIPDAHQNTFEKTTLDIFAKMMETRFGYTMKFRVKDE